MTIKKIERKLTKLARKLKKENFIEGNVSSFEITIYPDGSINIGYNYFEYPDFKHKPVIHRLDKWL